MSKNINAEDVTVTQTANDILTDPCASYWLKDAVRALERRDPVDAFLDATRLLECFRARLEALHGRRSTASTAPGLDGQKIRVHGYELECPVPPCYKEDR